MLTIRPIEQKEEQERLCGLCGIPYRADALAYSCDEEQERIGICQFHLHDGGIYLDDLATLTGMTDTGALFIMGRAALNFGDLAGFHDAYYPAPADDKIAKMIGFKKNPDGEWYMDLRGFFTSPCSCDSK